MAHHNTIFSQLLKLMPRREFEALAKRHHKGRRRRAARGVGEGGRYAPTPRANPLQRVYYAACICLLVAVTGLRFHDLSEHYLRSDEGAGANFSRGTFSETISNTQCCNTSPVLYPLILYAVQKVESTLFSIRIVPASASVLTVAVMLFLLPRLGVARGAAFLAALLAALSAEAIRHAQDAREYSIDALLALLMVAGLLRYLRDSKKALLCTSLLVAPLMQYGLVLFGIAAIGAAVVTPRASGQERLCPNPGRIRDWLKRRLDLIAPAGFFLVGCTISYFMTLRYQWYGVRYSLDSYLSPYYHQGKFDAHSIFEFSIDGIWSLLKYHLPEVVAIVALLAFAILLVVAFPRRFQGKLQDSAIAVIFSLCIAVSVGAAVLELYPLGGIRQSIYLGPIVFLAVGLAFHSGADALASTTRQAWLGHLLIGLSASAIVLAGVDAIRRADLYRPDKGGEILATLQESAQEDVVYVSRKMGPVMRFHKKGQIGKVMVYGKARCIDSPELCFQEMVAAIIPQAGRSRLWLFFEHSWNDPWSPRLRVLQVLAAHVSVEHVVSGGSPNLYLIEDTENLIKIATATDMLKNVGPLLPRKPSIRSTFDVYLREGMLFYVKEPCGAEDVQEPFFLHIDPADASDLPDYRKRHGFDNFDFRFRDYSFPLDEGCVALRTLPGYDFTGIRTGQYNNEGRLWEGEIHFNE